MNIGKIYSEATASRMNTDNLELTPDGSIQEKQKVNEEQVNSAAQSYIKSNWLQSTVTEKLIKEFTDKYNENVAEAISLATCYHQHQNHNKIIANLIRANELNKILNQIKKL